MTVDDKRIITIAYVLRDGGPEGVTLEIMDNVWPFRFFFGNGQLLPAFEEKIKGLEEGAAFEFKLLPDEAYGAVREENIVDVPMEVFEQSKELPPNALAEGGYIALTDDQGDTHNGKILSKNEEHVKVDFNHIMAGKTLHFKGVILNVRDARPDEVEPREAIIDDGVHLR